MNIASRNIQEKTEHNLFKYPSEMINPGWTGSINEQINIIPWTWQRWTSYIGGNAVNLVCRNITDKSVEVKRQASYLCGVFVDLLPGKYMLSLNTSNEITFYINWYLKQENGKYMFIKNLSTIFTAGYNQYLFNVDDGFCIRLDFGNDNGIWSTLTNIKIVEV